MKITKEIGDIAVGDIVRDTRENSFGVVVWCNSWIKDRCDIAVWAYWKPSQKEAEEWWWNNSHDHDAIDISTVHLPKKIGLDCRCFSVDRFEIIGPIGNPPVVPDRVELVLQDLPRKGVH
jgi:hypothetical protein